MTVLQALGSSSLGERARAALASSVSIKSLQLVSKQIFTDLSKTAKWASFVAFYLPM